MTNDNITPCIAKLNDKFVAKFVHDANNGCASRESVRILINAMNALAQDKEFDLPKKDIAFLHNQIYSICTDLLDLLPLCTANAIDDYRVIVFREICNEENLNYYDDYCGRVGCLINSCYDLDFLTPFKSLTASLIKTYTNKNAWEIFEVLTELSVLADHPIFDSYS